MKKTQSKPATPPAAAPVTVAQPPTKDNTVNLYQQLFDTTVHDLALGEGEVAVLARQILRMRRDKAPREELERLVKPLFFSVIGSCLSQEGTEDTKTGMWEYQIKQTPQLKALLRKLRKSAA